MVTWERIWVTRSFHIAIPIMYFVLNWILFRKNANIEKFSFHILSSLHEFEALAIFGQRWLLRFTLRLLQQLTMAPGFINNITKQTDDTEHWVQAYFSFQKLIYLNLLKRQIETKLFKMNKSPFI